jgi:hypothetical protein
MAAPQVDRGQRVERACQPDITMLAC